TYCRAFVRALPIPFPRPTYPDQPLGAVPEMGGHHHAGKHGDTSAQLSGDGLSPAGCGGTTRLFHVAGTGGRSVDEYPDDPERVAAGRPELLGRGRWPGRVATGDIGRGYCGDQPSPADNGNDGWNDAPATGARLNRGPRPGVSLRGDQLVAFWIE